MGGTKLEAAAADSRNAALNEVLNAMSPGLRFEDLPKDNESDYAPSTTGLLSLVPMEVSELVHGQRALGRRLFLQIVTAEYGEGCTMICRGDEEIMVHCMVSHPFGRTSTSLPAGTLIDVKEPFMRQMCNSKEGRIISVHHPSDLVFWPQHVLLDHLRDPAISTQSKIDELMALGNATLLKNAPLAAAQVYDTARTLAASEPNSQVPLTDPLRAHHEQALLKEAFAYLRCGRFSAAISTLTSLGLDGKECLQNYPQVARQSITALSALERWDAALSLAKDSLDRTVDRTWSYPLAQRIQFRLDEQLHGTYDFDLITRQADRKIVVADVADYFANVEQCSSTLSGNGLFARSTTHAGDLLLFEKAFALTQPSEHAPVWKLSFTKPGGRNRANTLLDKLAEKSAAELEHWRHLFELYSGDKDAAPIEVDGMGVFDTHRAQRIIQHNAHTTFPLSCHVQHDAFDPSCPAEIAKRCAFTADQQCLGIWIKASRFNHSCMPNCHWSWMSNIMVVRAVRPIARGEELTISYAALNQTYDQRTATLAQNGFMCTCPLCKADLSLSATQLAARSFLDKLPARLPTRPGEDIAKIARNTLNAFSTHLASAYPAELYANQQLPAPILAGPLVALAHMTLGPTISSWRSASASATAKAATYLHACLSLALQLDLAYAHSTAHCELLYKPHSQARFVGVLALMALAELAYLSPKAKEKARCAPLKWLAKQMYLVCYGEDVSFKGKHQAYACKDVNPERSEKPDEEEWQACVEEADEKGKAAWEFWKQGEKRETVKLA